MNEVDRILRKVISQSHSPKLSINENKTVVATKKVRRQVTGMVLNLEGSVSIGRENKRAIRASIDYYRKGKFDPKKLQHLAGHLAHVWNVERTFYQTLERVYGKELLSNIKRLGRIRPSI